MVRYNYLEKRQKPIFLKPKTDIRDSHNRIVSRIGLEAECDFVEDFIRDFDSDLLDCDAIIIDEVQFLKKEEVDFFAKITDIHNIPILCY